MELSDNYIMTKENSFEHEGIRVLSQNNLFPKKNSQINTCFKIILKLVSHCDVIKTVVTNYDFGDMAIKD